MRHSIANLFIILVLFPFSIIGSIIFGVIAVFYPTQENVTWAILWGVLFILAVIILAKQSKRRNNNENSHNQHNSN